MVMNMDGRLNVPLRVAIGEKIFNDRSGFYSRYEALSWESNSLFNEKPIHIRMKGSI